MAPVAFSKDAGRGNEGNEIGDEGEVYGYGSEVSIELGDSRIDVRTNL